MLANDVLRTIGNTPHIRINRLFGDTHSVYVKSERANPGGSIKDRIALAMVEAAEAAGALKAGVRHPLEAAGCLEWPSGRPIFAAHVRRRADFASRPD